MKISAVKDINEIVSYVLLVFRSVFIKLKELGWSDGPQKCVE